MHNRTVFFISDSTGITAETFGSAILAQFELKARHVRLPFTDSADKAHQAVREINHCAHADGNKPIVFTTLVNRDLFDILRDGCQGMLLDMFGTFVRPLEAELQQNPATGSAVSTTPAKARNTTTGSKRSISPWHTTTGSRIAIWSSPTSFWSA